MCVLPLYGKFFRFAWLSFYRQNKCRKLHLNYTFIPSRQTNLTLLFLPIELKFVAF
ncbi:hypothetical protein NEICINOT_04230 [Neisseria cinerea ATCC 14685]|uniref:Uncharacterized protein n=1 Tax=Neisseria cinerea ATCC 14685 TaxID=546262 RepID=D0W3J0_NEICI|nr:hypothetical protein NEICINOT_04230 [Neisseria cinerea ATCC 14685]